MQDGRTTGDDRLTNSAVAATSLGNRRAVNREQNFTAAAIIVLQVVDI